MLLIEGEARYADLIEQTLYNAVLPGVSLDGETYFYQNPLADEGEHRRQPWFHTACCPPNVARLLASLPGYVYALGGEDEIWVHLYAEGTARSDAAGRPGRLASAADPLSRGTARSRSRSTGERRVRPAAAHPGLVREGATLTVNGEAHVDRPASRGRTPTVRRVWQPGDVVRLSLPMPVRRIVCHPRVEENVGRVALMRGPLLYCLEQVDHSDVDMREIAVPDEAVFETVERRTCWAGSWRSRPRRRRFRRRRGGRVRFIGRSTPSPGRRSAGRRGSRRYRTTPGRIGRRGRCGSGSRGN